jgi:DNA-binding PadR family transcriptional regulator
MKSDYILQILASSPALTISELVASLRFLEMDTKFSSLHCFRMSVYQSLIFLMREGYVIRSDADQRSEQSRYQITQDGLDHLQSMDNLELVKKLIERVM